MKHCTLFPAMLVRTDPRNRDLSTERLYFKFRQVGLSPAVAWHYAMIGIRHAVSKNPTKRAICGPLPERTVASLGSGKLQLRGAGTEPEWKARSEFRDPRRTGT